jgi:hypothetical protein
MNFFETPARRLCIVRACGLFVVALGIGLFPFLVDIDKEGQLFCFAGAGFCLLLGALNVWWARRTPPDETVTAIVDRAPVPAQIRYYRRVLWLSAITFPLMTVWVAYDLSELESGRADDVTIWAPLVPIYANFGYWPTVLSLFLTGVCCCVLFSVKIRKLRAHESRGES